MAAQAGKKKQKMKGTKMALTEFLSPSDEPASFGKPDSSSWAAEMDNVDFDDVGDLEYIKPRIDRSKLPTAPKASRGPDIDMSRVPSSPPYTAFIGNLPYEASEEKIADFFRNQKVVNVRLPTENGRFRGFGYVEFEDRQSLVEALSLNEENMAGRKIRVDLAGQNQQNNDRGDRRDDGPDRTESDWRRRDTADENGPSRYGGRQNDSWGRNRDDDRGRGSFGDRDRGFNRGFDDRGPPRGRDFDDRGPPRGRDFDDRGPPRGRDYDDRGPPRGRDFDDRGPPRGRDFDDRGPPRGRDFDDRGPPRGRDFDDRGPPRGRDYDDRGPPRGRDYDDRGPPRGRDYDDRGPPRGRDYDRGYDDRGPSRGGYSGDRGYGGGRDRGYNRSFDRDDGGRRAFGSGFRRDGDRYGRDDRGYRSEGRYERSGSPESSRDIPKERPKLHLQPRSVPLENPSNSTESSTAPRKVSSIFGDAKPVDTAAREREIEERLQQKQRMESSRREDDKENRTYHNNMENRSYSRHDSHDSEKSHEGRQRRLSSNSSKGRQGPPPVTSPSRSRRDSEISNHSSGEVFSGGEDVKEEPRSPTSPSRKTDEPPVKMVPAPPPQVNIWDKRKNENKPPAVTATASAAVTVNATPPKKAVVSAAASPPKRDSVMSDSKSSPPESSPPSVNAWSRGKPADLKSSEPPRENVWAKRAQERDQSVKDEVHGERGAFPGNDRQRRPFGRGETPHTERGRGRGGRGGSAGRGRSKSAKEKHIPKSLDEMPKFEDKVEKDWSDTNKFAGLIDDEEES